MKRNSRVYLAQARAVQGWVTSWEEGCRGGKNYGVKPAQSWVALAWVTSRRSPGFRVLRLG